MAYALASLLLVLSAACDLPGSYATLGEPLDTIVSVGAKGHSTWMRADETGAEMLLLGRVEDDGVGQIVFARIEQTTETTLTAGTYTKIDDNHIQVHYQNMYRYPFEPNVEPLNKEGATLVEVDITINYVLEYEQDSLLLSEGREQQKFTALAAVLSRLDPATQDDWLLYTRFFNLCVLTSQARVPGFGGGRMVQYIGKKVTFKGMISGEFVIEASGVIEPVTHVKYKEFSDFSGVVLDGVQSTVSSMGGDGHLYNTLDFVFPADPDDPGVVVTGTVDYGTRKGDRGVQIKNGTATAGSYRVSIEGAPAQDIDCPLSNEMDFASLFL